MDTSGEIIVPLKETFSSSWMGSLWFQIFLLTAFGLGIFFRVAGLGNKIYSHDEAYTSLYAAGHLKSEVITSIRDGEDHTVQEIQRFLKPGGNEAIADALSSILDGPQQTPLFYLLAYYWMRLIGYTPAAMRGLAAIFGLLSIPATYWFSKEVFQSQRIALLSTALFAISPFHILFAQDARYYSLWTLATLLSSAALLHAIRKNSPSTWFIYSLTLILGVYSHQLFILVTLVHGFYFAGLFLAHHKGKSAGFLSACLLTLLAYTPWLFVMMTYWDRAAGQMAWVNRQIPWYQYIQNWVVIFSSPFLDFDFFFGNLISYLLRALVLALVAYSFLFLVLHASKQEKLFLLLMFIISAGAFIVPDLILGGIRSIGGRYFVSANIATILVVAFFIANALDQPRPNTYRMLRLSIGLLMVASVCSNLNSLQSETWWNKELGRVRPEFVHEINKDQTLLIVSTGYHGSTIGDVLLLSLEVDSDVHFRLLEEPDHILYPSNYDYVYWFPGSFQEVQEISENERLQVSEAIPGTLWRIDGIKE